MDLSLMRQNIRGWLELLHADLDSGRFRFCLKGNLVPIEEHSAHFTTIFAMRIAWCLGLWDEWPNDRKDACIAFVKSFQGSKGYFSDPWLLSTIRRPWKKYLGAMLGRAKLPQRLSVLRENALKAETRQSATTLAMVHEVPNHKLPTELTSRESIDTFFRSKDWTDPWSSCSHLSHQLTFLAINRAVYGESSNYDRLVDHILFRLNEMRNPQTGGWYKGNPRPSIILNGAMKVFSGLQWIDRPYPDCSKLLDFALEQPFNCHGCEYLNHLFVLFHCLKGTDANDRAHDVLKVSAEAARLVPRFSRDDGAFSFYADRASSNYYGAKVSKGLAESDLHGTMMVTWGLAVIEQIQRRLDGGPVKNQFSLFLN
ncbi:MAG: hypothetical protein SWH78_16330 [Thermodesulfobacteriota bacterium]|nr:hypothetical protein [Thermodesulfobacteriota bacterium]